MRKEVVIVQEGDKLLLIVPEEMSGAQLKKWRVKNEAKIDLAKQLLKQ